MDAWDDLSDDFKKERYNPLTAVDPKNTEDILTMLIGECAEILFTLPLKNNEAIIRKILYQGVWAKYSIKTAKKDKKS